MATSHGFNIYLRWEKRLRIKIKNTVNKLNQINCANYDLFDGLELPKLEEVTPNEKYQLQQRYYTAYLYKDVLGSWTLTKINGGIGTARGKIVSHYCPTYNDGLKLIEDLKRVRKGHKYELTIIKEVN